MENMKWSYPPLDDELPFGMDYFQVLRLYVSFREGNIQGCRFGPESSRQTLVSPIYRSGLVRTNLQPWYMLLWFGCPEGSESCCISFLVLTLPNKYKKPALVHEQSRNIKKTGPTFILNMVPTFINPLCYRSWGNPIVYRGLLAQELGT